MNNRTTTIPPPLIPLLFFATSVATLGATLLWVIVAMPPMLALLHVLVAGVFAMVAMGALYQFIPVVGMAPLRFAPLAYVHWCIALCGTAVLIYGFDRGALALVAAGGGLHAAGAFLEAIVLFSTLAKAKNAGMPARLAAVAFTWLIATMVVGVFVARGDLAPQTHAAIGLIGFYGTLITAVSFRLLRMFERVNVETRAPLRALLVTATGVAAVFVPFAAYVIAAVIAAVFVGDLFHITRRRNPAYQPETLYYALVSGLGALFAAAAAAYGMAYSSVVLAVWFYIGCAVIGYMQRIVPFIWWLRRSRLEGTRNIPTLAGITSPRLGIAILALWSAAGIWWLLHPLTPWPAAVALCAWLLLLRQLSLITGVKQIPGSGVQLTK